MDDFVINVRQLAQYPAAPSIGPSDVLLLQQGGVGGAYKSVTQAQLLNGPGASIGLSPPRPSNGLTTSFVTSLLGARQGFNWYVDQGGVQRYLQGGIAGIWSFGQDGNLTFSVAPSQNADAQLFFAQPLFQLGSDGSLTLPRGQVTVCRDPVAPNEVTTLQWVQNNTVTSFNGQCGDVTLSGSDVLAALCLDPCDPIATQSWVGSQICDAIQDWYNVAPFVFTFNGRVGDVSLTMDDIESLFFATPGVYPTAPNPPLGDASNRIATTMFVDESLEEWAFRINSEWNSADYELLNIIQTQYAPLNSPSFSGMPTGPTANPGTSTAQLATTAFVQTAVAESVVGVASFNTRTGHVVLDQQDIITAQGWDNVSLTGVPLAPTAPPGTQTGQIATTAFVLQQLQAIDSGVISFNNRSGVVSLTLGDVTGVGGAPINNTALTGVPTAATAAAGTNTSQLATTAFVLANTAASFNGRTGAITLTANDVSAAGGALLASPAFIGTPSGPTANPGTSTGQFATTQFVQAAIAAMGGAVIPTGTVMLFWQAAAPVGWTQVTTQNDKALRVVSGTGGVAGGTNAFSSVMAQSTVGNHTLTLGEMAASISSSGHNVFSEVGGYAAGGMYFGAGSSAGFVSGVGGFGAGSYNLFVINANPVVANSTGGTATVASTNTTGGAHNHPITMNIQYIDVILASKN